MKEDQEGLTTTSLTPEQKRQWEETVSMLSIQAPGFLHLMYSMLNHQSEDGEFVAMISRDVPIAATDAVNVILNPDGYFKFGLPQRVFVAAHEIVHCMYFDVEMLHTCVRNGHVLMPDGRKLDFDMDKMQLAMDARINALLIESKIGKRPDIGWFDDAVKGGDSVYTVYERYMSQKPPQGGQPGTHGNPGGKPGNQPGKPGDQPGQLPPGNGNPNNGFDKLLKPGEATGKRAEQAKPDKERWAVEIQAAETLEKLSQGDLPAGMQKMFKELLQPEISWLDVIELDVKQQVGDGAVDWTQPHPWYGTTDDGDYFYPGDTGYGCDWIVVWGDTSGSVFSDGVQARNIGELAGVIEQVRPKRLTLIWCDAGLKKDSVVELSEASDLRNLVPVGGGGTNYFPVLEWIKNNGNGAVPDLFIGATDGYVTFPKTPHPFPTIWMSSTPLGAVDYPFGKVVYINNIRRAA